MKKACSVLLSVLLIFTMQLCVFAEAVEIGKTQLKTVVPNTHEITVTYNDGGYVLKDGNLIASGAKFAVDRFDSLSLGAVAKLDSHLERVTVNGKDYTGKLQYGMLRFDSVTTDMNIVFTFKKCFGPTEPTTNPTEPTEPTRPTEPTAPTDPTRPTEPTAPTDPSGTTGLQLDLAARMDMWAEGYDFGHGTGHGVGSHLCVHEGPQQIRKDDRACTRVIFKPGMTITDEPGIYIEGKFGVRIENTLLCVPDRTTDFGTFLRFEVLTLCPYDIRTLDLSLLSSAEVEQINTYHHTVREQIMPLLTDEADKLWLARATASIDQEMGE